MSNSTPVTAGGNGNPDKTRIGVFICHCGGNISDVVDVHRVSEEISKLPNVVLSTTEIFMCSDPGQASIEKAIKDHDLNRVIIAACSPTLHELTFRRACARAGLNPYLFEHVNIREHVSWVIEDHDLATDKSIRLISAAVGRIRFLVPLETRKIPIHDAALVIGGGVAGLTSALDLARRGINVFLAEKESNLGGRMLELGTVFPTNENASDLIDPLVKEVEAHRLITVYKNAELKNSHGSIGDFNVTFSVNKNDGTTSDVEIKAGVIVIAAGLDVYEPGVGEYFFKKSPKVVGLLDFQKMLMENKLEIDRQPVRSVGFMHCVGSRQWDGVHKPQADGKINDYCSRYCCTALVHAACEVKEKFRNVAVYEFYEDIRTYGRGHEDWYTKAKWSGR